MSFEAPKQGPSLENRYSAFLALSDGDWNRIVDQGIPLYEELRQLNKPKEKEAAADVRDSLERVLRAMRDQERDDDHNRLALIKRVEAALAQA